LSIIFRVCRQVKYAIYLGNYALKGKGVVNLAKTGKKGVPESTPRGSKVKK
jgi:hypothetical protein